MGLFSDLVFWIFVGNGGWWIGGTLITTAVVASIWLGIQRYGGVSMTDPVIPQVTREIQRIGAETYQWPTTPMPPANWTPYVDKFTEAVDDTATAVIEITADMVADPLAATIEIQRIEDSPLFYSIKHPKPFELESYTDTITRAQIERAKAAKEMAA